MSGAAGSTPPSLPRRLLERALRDDPAGPSILGDLQEDFALMVRARGPGPARRWYWREATLLAAGRILRPGGTPRGRRPGSDDTGAAASWGHDLRSALRAVGRDRAFSLFTVLVIGLGVGATTAVFSVTRPLMIAPLPFEEPERLVWIANDDEGDGLSAVTSRSGNLRDFRRLARSFEGLTGYNAFFNQQSWALAGREGARQLIGAEVAHDFLDVLGVRPALGRSFTEAEGRWQGPRAVILTHGLWRQEFAGDPGVVGRPVVLDDQPWEVVGVLPEDFDFQSVFTPAVEVDFLRTFAIADETDRWGNTLSIIGRLRPGVTPAEARAELDAIVRGLQEEQPDRWGLGARLLPLREHLAGPFRGAMLVLVAAAAGVMLLVCANLANMLLARSPRRTQEVAVRRSLGATRARVVRHLVAETVVLGVAGAGLGLAIAWAVTRRVAATSAVAIPLLDRVQVDVGALAFSVLVAVAAAVLASLAPALRVAEGGEAEVLREAGRGRSGSRGSSRLRDGLVVAEVALACLLLVVSGLFLRSFDALLDVDLGFRPEGRVAWQLDTTERFGTPGEEAAYWARITDRVGALPGVAAVGLVDAVPLGKNRSWGVQLPERRDEVGAETFAIAPHLVDPGYRAAMGIPLVAGRDLGRDDLADAEPVILVNETAARRIFGSTEAAVGKELLAGGGWRARRIVGVVADVRHRKVEAADDAEVYFPIAQLWDYATLDLVVASSLPEQTLAPAVRRELAAVDPGMPTDRFWTMTGRVERAVSARRFTLTILGAFGAVALLLAAMGIYGVLSHSVAQRVPEIGLRMALGASGREVRRSVVRRTLGLAVVGIGIGSAAALAAGRTLASLLYEVEPTDPLTLAGTVGTLLVVAAAAGFLPALRASRTDAAVALKG